MILLSNRASPLIKTAHESVPELFAPKFASTVFSHWEDFGGKDLPSDQIPTGARVVRRIERKYANDLSNKARLARAFETRSLSQLAPETFFDLSSAVDRYGHSDDAFFFKSTTGTGGKGMFVVSGKQLSEQLLPRFHIIQKEVSDIHLLDGRKYTTRCYCLVHNGTVYLYRDGFILVHGVEYKSGSLEYAVQIDHAGYDKDDGPVRMALLSTHDNIDLVSENIFALIKYILPVLDVVTRRSSEDDYIILGIDLLIKSDMNPVVLEINTSPNFVHSKHINSELNIPFFSDSMRTIFLGNSRNFIAVS